MDSRGKEQVCPGCFWKRGQEEGRFILEGLPPGRALVRFRVADRPDLVREIVVGKPGEKASRSLERIDLR